MSIQGRMLWLAHTFRVFSLLMMILALWFASFCRILTSPVPLSFHSGGEHSWAYLKVEEKIKKGYYKKNKRFGLY
jgi:hypothetical protein